MRVELSAAVIVNGNTNKSPNRPYVIVIKVRIPSSLMSANA